MDKPRRAWLGITKKIVMAVTGLALCLFLVGHLGGNLLLFRTADNFLWFNTYARTLGAIPLVPVLSWGIIAMIVLHAYEGFLVWKQNKAARPIEYQGGKHWTKEKSGKSRKSTSSTLMMATGTIMLLFVAVHVWQMKYHNSIGPANPISHQKAGEAAPLVGADPAGGIASGEAQTTAEAVQDTRDLSDHVVYEFKKPYVVAIYLACMIALGLHLNHAVWSAFQTLGATNSTLRKAVIGFGQVFTIVIAGGFFLLPLWVFFFVEAPK